MGNGNEVLARLRKWETSAATPNWIRPDIKRAADEIERLRVALEEIRALNPKLEEGETWFEAWKTAFFKARGVARAALEVTQG